MSERLSEGPIQVTGTSVFEINEAFRQVQERTDHLKGLRGRTLVFDRIRADNPSVDQDVVTRGSLATLAQLVFIAGPTSFVAYQPGTSFIEASSGLRKQFDFSSGQIGLARLLVQGWGTESGAGKGVRIATTDGTVVASVSWDGNSEGMQVGAVNTIALATDVLLQLEVSASTATESFILRSVILDLGI